jgi:RNA polymerase sigma-70 factor (ECF subfamily)
MPMPYNFVMPSQLGSGVGRSDFASTQWSMVLAAKGDGASIAMADLCAAYWRPLYAYVRRCGRSVEDAQDLTQSFFSRVLEKDYLQHVDPALGKFRAFLLASLKNFLTNEWRRERASKRGGAAHIVSIDDMTRAEDHYAAGLAMSQTPERVYERNWALALLERTTARLAREFAAAGKSRVFDALKPYLTGDRDARYSQVAVELGMSEVTVRVSVHRMRGRFRDLLQLEVAQTLPGAGDSRDVEEELRYLLTAL